MVIVFTLLSTTFALDEIEQLHQLFKRENGLPFQTLPSTQCSIPNNCNSLGNTTSLNCRCSDLLNVCQTPSRQYCWGSVTLNQTSNCPAVPSSCSSQFKETPTCLCNNNSVLCVDQHNNYCFATGQNAASLSLAPIPTAVSGSGSFNPSSATPTSSSATSLSSSIVFMISFLFIASTLIV